MSTTALTALFAGASIGLAAAQSDNSGTGMQQQNALAATTFESVDSDGDGTIARSEWQSASSAEANDNLEIQAFERIDTNGDGEVSESEFREAKTAGAESPRAESQMDAIGDAPAEAAQMEDSAGDMPQQQSTLAGMSFQAVDTNGDGQVTRDEWRSASERNAQDVLVIERFAIVDIDSSGDLTEDEFRQARNNEAFQDAGTQSQAAAQGEAQPDEARSEQQQGDANVGEQATASTRVDELVGENVQNDAGDVIGEIDDIAIMGGDLHAVVGVGGFLGIGDREVLIPFDRLQVNENNEVRLSMSEAELEGLPEFEYEQSGAQILNENETIEVPQVQ